MYHAVTPCITREFLQVCFLRISQQDAAPHLSIIKFIVAIKKSSSRFITREAAKDFLQIAAKQYEGNHSFKSWTEWTVILMKIVIVWNHVAVCMAVQQISGLTVKTHVDCGVDYATCWRLMILLRLRN